MLLGFMLTHWSGCIKMLVKGGVSDFWKPMLISEITKTNTPLLQKCLAPILIAQPHTYIAYETRATICSVKQSKTNVTSCLATPDASGAPKYYRSHYNQWCCLHWMLRGSTRQIPSRKLLPRSIYDVLTQISNDFQRSLYHVQCRQTLAVAARCIWCRHGVTNLSRRTKATSALVKSESFLTLHIQQRNYRFQGPER